MQLTKQLEVRPIFPSTGLRAERRINDYGEEDSITDVVWDCE